MPIPIFQCDYCGFVGDEWQETVDHEESCEENPANKCCATCNNLAETDDGTISPFPIPKCTVTNKQEPEERDCVLWKEK